MSSKVVEANAGVHSLAMAVAPVTSWRLYGGYLSMRGKTVLTGAYRLCLHGTLYGFARQQP